VGFFYTSKQGSIKGSDLETETAEGEELMVSFHKHTNPAGCLFYSEKGLV